MTGVTTIEIDSNSHAKTIILNSHSFISPFVLLQLLVSGLWNSKQFRVIPKISMKLSQCPP